MEKNSNKEYLNGLSVWALSFGGIIGWGCFIMPGSRFLPSAGPLGSIIGIMLASLFAIIICFNYSVMVKEFPEKGGSYVFTRHILGEDHAFLAVWCLILAYLSLIWTNSTAISLMIRYLAGDVLRWGFHYTVAGYNVYLGEVLTTVLIVLVLGLITAYNCRLANLLRTIFAILIFVSITVIFISLLVRNGLNFNITPAFATGDSTAAQILKVSILAPWMFLGFEAVTHAVGEAKFSVNKLFTYSGIAILCGMAMYIIITLIAIASQPGSYGNWQEYISDLDNLSGIEQVPFFYNVATILGDLGTKLLMVAAVSVIATSVLAFFRSGARVCSVMAQHELLPERFSHIDDSGVPVNACLLMIGISIPVTFLGRAVVEWTADVSTLAVTVVYAYISICTYKTAKSKSPRYYLGIVGTVSSILILTLLLIPNVFSHNPLTIGSYFMLAVWSLVGMFYYRRIFMKDKKSRFGKSTIMWFMMLLLLFFSTNIWVSLMAERHLYAVTDVPEEIINSQLRAASLIQLVIVIIALFVIFSLFRQVMIRQKEADMLALRAQEHNRAKSTFLSNMSHDIRTPMNTIVGMTDVLLREGLPEQSVEYVQNIKTSSERLLSLVNDILDFSKIESGHIELEEEEYDFIQMVKELSVLFISNIGGKPVELIYDISPNVPSKMFGDTKRISQIMTNLVGNAIKYTDYGYVCVKVRPGKISGDTAVIEFSVTDSGRGIKEEDFDKIFQSFSQVDTKKNRGIEGAGLGLAISRQLVELMGGSISVESEYGRGSTFRFTITQKVIDPTPNTIPDKDNHLKRVAFSFDDPHENKAFIALSKELGFNATQIDGTESTSEFDYGYFITDHHELAKRILKEHEDICSVALVHNPMITSHPMDHFVIINKPLFCRNMNAFLNGESINEEYVAAPRYFTAPDARILIVDDMPMNLKVATEILKPLKMHVDQAFNGREALDKIYAGNYDLVFMDHMMPVMDGIEAITELRKSPEDKYKNLPVVALTANATLEAKKLFESSGFSDFISKPIHISEALSCILKWVPSDKIKETDSDPALEYQSSPANLEASEVSIPGIDNEKGITNSGGESLFLNLLGDVYEIIDDKCALVESYLKEKDIRNYTIQVHALKTTCRMIGAMDLSEDFFTLEKLGNENNLEQIEELTPDVIGAFRELKPHLKPYVKEKPAQEKSYDKEAVEADLKSLISSIRDFDLNAAEQHINSLIAYKYDDNLSARIKRLEELVSGLDYDEASVLASDILKEL